MRSWSVRSTAAIVLVRVLRELQAADGDAPGGGQLALRPVAVALLGAHELGHGLTAQQLARVLPSADDRLDERESGDLESLGRRAPRRVPPKSVPIRPTSRAPRPRRRSTASSSSASRVCSEISQCSGSTSGLIRATSKPEAARRPGDERFEAAQVALLGPDGRADRPGARTSLSQRAGEEREGPARAEPPLRELLEEARLRVLVAAERAERVPAGRHPG